MSQSLVYSVYDRIICDFYVSVLGLMYTLRLLEIKGILNIMRILLFKKKKKTVIVPYPLHWNSMDAFIWQKYGEIVRGKINKIIIDKKRSTSLSLIVKIKFSTNLHLTHKIKSTYFNSSTVLIVVWTHVPYEYNVFKREWKYTIYIFLGFRIKKNYMTTQHVQPVIIDCYSWMLCKLQIFARWICP